MSLELTIKVTLILLAVALAGVLLRRSSAAVRHLLQVSGLVAVLVLPLAVAVLPAWELPVLEPPPVPVADSDARPLPASDSVPAHVSRPQPVGGSTTVHRGGGAESGAAGPVRTERATVLAALEGFGRALLAWAPWLWALGTFALLARLGAAWLRMTRLAIDATPLDCPATWRLIEACRRRLGIRVEPRVLASRSVSVPMLWGFRRPTLLLPEAAVTWPASRLRIVLLHELAHLRRLDGLALLVGRLAAAAWWFHPLVWVVERRARRDCERACDDVVLNCGERPSTYAGHLVEIAGELPAPKTAPAGSLALTGPGPLETRVMSILHPRTRRGLSPRFALVLLFVATLGLVSVSSAHLVERVADRPEKTERVAVSARAETRPVSVADRTTANLRGKLAEPRPAAQSRAVAAPAVRRQERAEAGIMLAHDDHGNEEGARAFKQAYSLHSEESFAEAIAGFEEAAAAGYRVGTSLYNAACGYARLGRTSEAVATLERSLDAGFNSYDLFYHDSDLDPIRRDTAFRQLLDALPEAHGDHRSVDRYEEAAEMYEYLLDEGSTDGHAWYMTGSTLLSLRDFDRAIDALGRAADHLGDRNQNALYNLACAHSLNGDSSPALDYLERAVLTGFDSEERFRNDSDLDNIRGESRFGEIEELHDTLSLDRFRKWGMGESEYSTRRWAPAVDEFNEFVSRNPDVGRAWYDLGWALHFSRRHDEARSAFEKQLDLGYRTDIATYNIACTYAMEGRSDDALTWLERAVDTEQVSAHQLLNDDDLKSLRDDARFEALVERASEYHDDHERIHKYKIRKVKTKDKEKGATLF